MTTFKQFLVDSADALLNTQYEMALRLELKCSQEQATELVAWLSLEKEWEDLSKNARAVIRLYFAQAYMNSRSHIRLTFDDWAMDRLADLLLDKYELDARELIG